MLKSNVADDGHTAITPRRQSLRSSTRGTAGGGCPSLQTSDEMFEQWDGLLRRLAAGPQQPVDHDQPDPGHQSTVVSDIGSTGQPGDDPSDSSELTGDD